MVDSTLDTQNRPSDATAATLDDFVSSASSYEYPHTHERRLKRKQNTPLMRVVCTVRSAKHARSRSRQLPRNSSENAGLGTERS